MSDFKAKWTKINFGWGSAGELTALPRSRSWSKGNLLLREGNGAGRGMERRQGRGREGRGREWAGFPCLSLKFALE